MTNVKENLVAVLDQIQENRASLVKNIGDQEKQILSMRTEMHKFDAVIAALQVSIADHNVLGAVQSQHDHAAKVPLKAPSAGTAAPAGGNDAGAAPSAGTGAEALPSVANDGSATA